MNTLKKFLQLKVSKMNIPKSKNTAKPEGIVHCTNNESCGGMNYNLQ